MILSVSRRTDIPAFYSEWFLNRIKEGYVYVRNPFNPRQISNVNIRPEVVDCIVFWSKDPLPLINKIKLLENYKYYFQFTITPYDSDIENNLRSKSEILKTFIELSKLIGKERVILRYDPILLTDKYTIDFHKRSFEKLCEKVNGYTERIVISYLDDYKKARRNMKEINLQEITMQQVWETAKFIGEAASIAKIEVETCAEEYDLTQFGIKRGKCIDGDLIERITGYKLKKLNKDGNRQLCLCDQCIDIGQYDSCINGCVYCYANVNKETAIRNHMEHSKASPILIGDYNEADVKVRKDVCSWRALEEEQREQIVMDF
jgi:hypothetical protein